MRIRAARRIAPACRGQWNGVRIERADGENAHRQSQRNHPMREHGSRWQQSELRRLALLSDPMRIVFRTHRRLSPRGGSQNGDFFATTMTYIVA